MSDTLRGRGAFGPLHWGAVISGVLLALAAHVVLGLFGAAFGFAAQPSDSRALGVGAGVWSLITPFVASWIGAWLAVSMAESRDDANASLHGVLVWCIGLIAGAIFLTGTLASGAMTAGVAAGGNAGAARIQAMQQMGRAPVGGPRADAAAEQVAKGAAAGSGAAGLAALLGLAGALIGANVTERNRSGRGFAVGKRRFGGWGRERGERLTMGDRYATSERTASGDVRTREGTIPPPAEVLHRDETLRDERRGIPPTDPSQHH